MRFSKIKLNDIANGVKTSVTVYDWLGMALICFVLPAVISTLICQLLKKAGWIKSEDLTLEL